jgi:hypothetical protein
MRYFRDSAAGLSDRDREVLAEHVAIRKHYGWGHGPERVFYTQLDLDQALKAGVERGFITSQEAQTEEKVLTYFRPRVMSLIDQSLPVLEGFPRTLAEWQADLTAFANQAARFVGGAPPAILFYMIANPSDDDIGGEYNGGFLTLEIPAKREAYPTLLHEVFHAFVETKKNALASAVKSAPGLDFETLNEGLAYAVSPGLYHTGEGDRLQSQVTSFISRRQSLGDSYARFNFYALALRPLLKDALNRQQNIETFLPRAVDAWLVLKELQGTVVQ